LRRLALAQSQAQQGAARAQHHPDHRDDRYARTDPDERVDICRSPSASPASSCASASWRSPTFEALAIARKQGLTFDIMSTSFFLSRRSLKASANRHAGMAGRLFIGLARSANDATDFFQIPTPGGRVGTQVAV